jgi:hypothetical protein
MLLLAVHADIALAYFASIGALFVRAKFHLGVHLGSLLAFHINKFVSEPLFSPDHVILWRYRTSSNQSYSIVFDADDGWGNHRYG